MPCANRLMKTGRPGCRTKVNDVINTAVSKRASLADIISFYFFFSPPFLSLSLSLFFFRSFIRPNKFDRAHVNIVLRVVARREGRGRVGIEGVTNVNWPKKKFYRLSICLGKRAGHCTPSPFSLSFAIECWKIGRNRVKIGWTHYSTIWGCACLEYDTDLMESRVL